MIHVSVTRFALMLVAAVLAGCGDDAPPDISGPWQLGVRYNADSCSPLHGRFAWFNVTVQQTGSRFSIVESLRFRGLDVSGLAGTVDSDHVEWTASGSAAQPGGCVVTASYTALGAVGEGEIRGTIDTVLTKSPASCEVPDFCPDAEFVYALLR